MADRHDSERLRGFGDGQTDICYAVLLFWMYFFITIYLVGFSRLLLASLTFVEI